MISVRAGFRSVAVVAAVFCLSSQTAQAGQAGPIGFASLGGGTTGGDPLNVCEARVSGNSDETRRNLDAAIACTQKGPQGGVVRFTGERVVTGGSPLHLPSNITLQGPVTFLDQTVRIFGQHNIIIRDLTFKSTTDHQNRDGGNCPEPTDPTTHGGRSGTSGCPKPLIIGGAQKGDPKPDWSHNIWIDHNGFDHCGDKCIVIGSGAPDASGKFTGSDRITISNNAFTNSYLATLFAYRGSGLREKVGSKTSICEKARQGGQAAGMLPWMRITVVGNHFSNVRQRSVRASYCTVQVHEFNNVIENMGRPLSAMPKNARCSSPGLKGKGPESVHGAQILFENNYVSAWNAGAPKLNGETCVDDIVQSGTGHPEKDKGGYIKLRGNLLLNGAAAHENGPERVFDRPPYAYRLLPAAEVYRTVVKQAGPRKS